MNKAQMAANLAKETGLSQSKAAECLNALFESKGGKGIIATELTAGRKVSIPGFGTFNAKRRAARVGTNPSNGQPIDIAANRYATWKPGKNLKERIAE